MTTSPQTEFLPPRPLGKNWKDNVTMEIWRLLNSGDNIIRMETAIYLSKPPVEAITPQLLKLKVFQDNVDDAYREKIKRIIGMMIRQILEQRGFRAKRGRYRISNKTGERQIFLTSLLFEKQNADVQE
ncbi:MULTISPECIES: hypothetical protein [Vibrio harveyi group]|uniref:hypothetical protein n=1 Tax=Vibrio harveyi group TaxID=717610 RepID=UPI001B813F10|nr:hypothetical protein [Vibrio parahaemolyticus]